MLEGPRGCKPLLLKGCAAVLLGCMYMSGHTCHPTPTHCLVSGKDAGTMWDSLKSVGGIGDLERTTKPSMHMALLVSGGELSAYAPACATHCADPSHGRMPIHHTGLRLCLLPLEGRAAAPAGGGRHLPPVAVLHPAGEWQHVTLQAENRWVHVGSAAGKANRPDRGECRAAACVHLMRLPFTMRRRRTGSRPSSPCRRLRTCLPRHAEISVPRGKRAERAQDAVGLGGESRRRAGRLACVDSRRTCKSMCVCGAR